MSDLWVEASRDIEAENATTELTLAKMATASIWPFLALARSEMEFGHRMALAEPQIESLVPSPVVRDQVIASFREDFQSVTGLPHQAKAPESVEELRKHRNLEGLKAKEEAGKDDEDEGDGKKTGSLEFYHAGLNRWVTAVENPGAPNPSSADHTPEAGPATGVESYHFPTAAPDPVDPINGEFPLQPSAWTVPPDKAWVERPMQFNPPEGGHQAAVGNPAQPTVPVGQDSHYTDEGVETGTGPNSNFFAGGTEGATGDPQSSFPADVSLPEEDERVDWYNNTPPQPITAYKHPGPDSGEEANRQRTNHGVCAGDDCGRPVYRKGNAWHHLEGEQDHYVLLHAYHPWVQQQMDRLTANKQAGFQRQAFPFRSGDRVSLTRDHHDPESGVALPEGHETTVDHVTEAGADGERWLGLHHPTEPNSVVYVPSGLVRHSVRHTAPGGGEHAPYKVKQVDGGYAVFNAKGERKNEEPKSEEDARQFQKALYSNVPGASEEAKKTGSFFDPADPGVRMIRRADVSSSDMGTGTQSASTDPSTGAAGAAGGSTPNVPPSMVPGGPGAEAMPQTIPNASVSQNPFAQGGGGGGGAAPAAQTVPPVTGMHRQADEYRGRPTSESPSGVADEYDSNTWEGPARQRPMQNAADRGINTPQRAREPIPQMSSGDAERPENGEEEEEGRD